MNNQEFLQSLLDSQTLNVREMNVLRGLRNEVEALLSNLEGNPRFYYGGSYGKNTIIRERYDLDIVVYWPKGSNYTIKSIYDGVGTQLEEKWIINSKTVAWEIPFEGDFHIDVVPGRALDLKYVEANLYRTDTGTTLKTSLKTHIDIVKNSRRRDVIRLMKLWRERNQVPFKKSFLLELMTIYGCRGTSYTNLESQVLAALIYIKDNIENIQIKDPANSNNSLSDDIPIYNKKRIRQEAQAAIEAKYWSDVFHE